MRRWIPLAVLAAAAGGALAITLADGPAEGPDESVQRVVWRMDGTVTHEDRWCGSCHYDQERMWQATWERSGSQWNLNVTPAYRGVSLLYVQAAQEEPVLWASGEQVHDWSPAEAWTQAFEVPRGAGGLLARVHAEPEFMLPGGAMADRATELVLVAPDGTRHAAAGPEDDLKLLVVADPAPGAWQFEARLTDAANRSAMGRAWIEVLGEEVASGAASFPFAAGPDGRPPDTLLRVRPYHDHHLDEDSDWDEHDVAPAREAFTALRGPAPDPAPPTEAEVEAAWNGKDAVVFGEQNITHLGIYRDEPGHHHDLGLGTSKPYYYPAQGLVPPGAKHLRFEFTWVPPIEESRLAIRFSPPGTPLYFEAEPFLKKPGQLVLEAPVDPLWPRVEEGTWDLAPYLKMTPGNWQATVLQIHLEASAHRSAPTGQQEALESCSRVLEDCTYGL